MSWLSSLFKATQPVLPGPGDSPTWGLSKPVVQPEPKVTPANAWHINAEPPKQPLTAPIILPPVIVEKDKRDLTTLGILDSLKDIHDDAGIEPPALPSTKLFPAPVLSKAAAEPKLDTAVNTPVKGKSYKVRISKPSKPEKIFAVKGKSVNVLGFQIACTDVGYTSQDQSEMYFTLKFGG